MNLCIIYGGKSNEREVSLSSLEMIMQHISKEKYNITLVDMPADGSCHWAKDIAANPPDVVLSALHGGSGENGAVQGFLECLNIPYIGSGVLSSALCMNKHMSKIIMEHAHIPCAAGILIKSPRDFSSLEDFLAENGLPVVVKPNNGGSSIGISIISEKAAIEKACSEIMASGDHVLVEKYYKGVEVTCGIIEQDGNPEILGILDIIPSGQFYDYEAKYIDSNTYIGQSNLQEFVQSMVKEIARKAFKVLACEDYARLDLIVQGEQVIVMEMNTLPGLTSHSLIPKAAQQLDGGFSGLLDILISGALIKTNVKQNNP